MKPGGSAALAMGVGYVLGRQHKLRTALMLGAAAAGGRMAARGQSGNGHSGDGHSGNGSGGEAKGHSHGLAGKLGSAGKSAAISAFARSADRVGDRLTERAAAMRGSGGEDK
ncbi:hypothetical protein [Asanoa iriomotensis]|uniref:Uncharacterized protein n=1 Tax=Asanoa iriomotensis TaxID=234613 RepID=A0ABQ4CCX6_9ACTN|nr:hypothetical protein [Asanoa iriomotensis]GIF60326.1 hypothetical protein Air01nite_64210 [Asanoa iriomotensis]